MCETLKNTDPFSFAKWLIKFKHEYNEMTEVTTLKCMWSTEETSGSCCQSL